MDSSSPTTSTTSSSVPTRTSTGTSTTSVSAKEDTISKEEEEEEIKKIKFVPPEQQLTWKTFFLGTNNSNVVTKPLQRKKKTHFGKADPKRDILALISLVCFMIYLAKRSPTSMNGTNTKLSDKPIEEQIATKLNNAIIMLSQLAISKLQKARKLYENSNRRHTNDGPCSVFIHPTSVPFHHLNNGQQVQQSTSNLTSPLSATESNASASTSTITTSILGLFAGKDYSIGDIIFNISTQSMLSPTTSTTSSYSLISFQYEQPCTDTAAAPDVAQHDDISNSDTCITTISIPSYAIIMKHHPSMYNVDGMTILHTTANTTTTTPNPNNDDVFIVRATQPIQIGQELFFHPNRHLLTTIQPELSKLQKQITTSHLVDNEIPVVDSDDMNTMNQLIAVYKSLASIYTNVQQTIPTTDTYTIADSIAHDIGQTLQIRRRKQLYKNKKKKKKFLVFKNPKAGKTQNKTNKTSPAATISRRQQQAANHDNVNLNNNQQQPRQPRIPSDDHVYDIVKRSILKLIDSNNHHEKMVQQQQHEQNEVDGRTKINFDIDFVHYSTTDHYKKIVSLLPSNNRQYKDLYTTQVIDPELDEYIMVPSSSMYRSIKNNTLLDLQIAGSCMYDIDEINTTIQTDKDSHIDSSDSNTVTSSTSSSGPGTIIRLANRHHPVANDTVLYNIPILVLPKVDSNNNNRMTTVRVGNNDDDSDKTCTTDDMHSTTPNTDGHHCGSSSSSSSPSTKTSRRCLGYDVIESSVVLCPLSIEDQHGHLWMQIPITGTSSSSSSSSNVQYKWTRPYDDPNNIQVPIPGSVVYLHVVTTTKLYNGDPLYSNQSLKQTIHDYLSTIVEKE